MKGPQFRTKLPGGVLCLASHAKFVISLQDFMKALSMHPEVLLRFLKHQPTVSHSM